MAGPLRVGHFFSRSVNRAVPFGRGLPVSVRERHHGSVVQRWKARASLTAALLTVALAGCTFDDPSPVPVVTDVPMDVVAERAAHTATTLADGRVFVAGGCITDGCANATGDTFLIDADGQRSERGPELIEPRSSHTATLLDDGRVVVVGGFLGETGGVSDAIEVFDPRNGVLLQPGSVAQPRGGHAAARLSDGRVMIVGGWVGSHRYTGTVEIFDPTTSRVVAAQPLPWAADALEATSLPDGRVLVTGGQVASGQATSAAAVFHEATGTWQTISPMSSSRLKHFAVLLDDGRVLVGGGTPDDRVLLSTTEVFDPKTDSFTVGPLLREGRYKLPGGVVALPGSRVLVAGGGATAEVVDIIAGSSDLLTAFDSRASFATVNMLSDDAALILGGYDERIDLSRLNRIVRLPDRRSG